MQFTAAVTDEGEWYVSRAPEAEEALVNLREAILLYFEDETRPEGIEAPIIPRVQLSA